MVRIYILSSGGILGTFFIFIIGSYDFDVTTWFRWPWRTCFVFAFTWFFFFRFISSKINRCRNDVRSKWNFTSKISCRVHHWVHPYRGNHRWIHHHFGPMKHHWIHFRHPEYREKWINKCGLVNWWSYSSLRFRFRWRHFFFIFFTFGTFICWWSFIFRCFFVAYIRSLESVRSFENGFSLWE